MMAMAGTKIVFQKHTERESFSSSSSSLYLSFYGAAAADCQGVGHGMVACLGKGKLGMTHSMGSL